MKYTQAELYEWAHDLVCLQKDPQFLAMVANKPDGRHAGDLARQVIEFAEDEANMEEIVAYGRNKKNKNSAAETESFSLTDL